MFSTANDALVKASSGTAAQLSCAGGVAGLQPILVPTFAVHQAVELEMQLGDLELQLHGDLEILFVAQAVPLVLGGLTHDDEQ
jgi:hypothetical protein